MGNNPSANARSQPASSNNPAPSSSTAHAARREPKLRDNIQPQRIAVPPEPSMAQARGTSVIHGSRKSNSQSPANSQSSNTGPTTTPILPSQVRSNPLPTKVMEEKSEMKEQVTQPVAVPIPTSNAEPAPKIRHSSMDASLPPADALSYHLTRPPRLPLPIEEEIHTPGSPIIAPADASASLLNIEALDDDVLPRRSSALSSTTAEDDEDTEELPVDKTKAVVPIEFVWRGEGEKIYVTGTIFQWSRKSKLLRE
jgi:hypothetical protein